MHLWIGASEVWSHDLLFNQSACGELSKHVSKIADPCRILVAHALGHMGFAFCAEDDSSLTEEEKALARFQRQRMKELTGKY